MATNRASMWSLSFIFGLLIILAEWQGVYSILVSAIRKDKWESTILQRERWIAEMNAVTASHSNTSSGKRKFKYIGGKILYYANSVKTYRLIISCGDVEQNPGPSNQCASKTSRWKYPCAECTKPVKNNQDGIPCVDCARWYHANCAGISSSMFRTYYLKTLKLNGFVLTVQCAIYLNHFLTKLNKKEVMVITGCLLKTMSQMLH